MLILGMHKTILKVTYADNTQAVVMRSIGNRDALRALESNHPTLWPQFRAKKVEPIDKSVDNLFNKGEKRG